MAHNDDSTPTNHLQALRQQAEAARAAEALKEPTSRDLKRADKLERLLKRLQTGQIVQNRDIQKWTTEEEYQSIELAWERELEQRVRADQKPSELQGYELHVKTADFYYWRGNKRSNASSAMAEKFFHLANTAYERALERLEEIMAADPTIAYWLDRDVDFTPKGDLSLCPDGVPRLITSRSHCRRPGSSLFRENKRQIKAGQIAQIIENIRNPAPVVDSSHSSRLGDLLEQASRLGDAE